VLEIRILVVKHKNASSLVPIFLSWDVVIGQFCPVCSRRW